MNEIFYQAPDESYYLSYLNTPSALAQAMDKSICEYKNKDPSNIGRSETAICIVDPWKCLILYDDQREAYKPIADDLDACKQYWLNHPELHSHTSDYLN